MKAPKQRFKILQFINPRTETTSWRVSGIKRNGQRVRENFADSNEAQLRYTELEGEFHAASYEWNTDLNGHRIDETQTAEFQMKTAIIPHDGGPGRQATTNVVLRFAPETTSLLVDYRDFHPRSPRSGKNVLFMDAHVAPR